jgi:ADP-heptose:LPS heptosyltransferase
VKDQILIIKLGALGDLVQATGPIAAIRAHHAGARIVLLTTAPYADLMRACPWIDEVWVDARPSALDVAAWLDLRQRLRAGNFARVYDLQTSDRSSFYYRLFFPGPMPEWSGIAAGCSHPHDNPERDLMHTLDRQKEQLRIAGIASVPAPDLSWVSADVSRFGLEAGRYVLLVPGGAAHRPEKRWPADHYKELSARLAATGVKPVLIGAEGERALLTEIAAAVPSFMGEGAVNLAGQTSLAEIAVLARKAGAAVGNDTGPMHVAAVAGAKCVVLYSDASDPRLCAQKGPDVTILQWPRLEVVSTDEVAEALHL